MIVGDADRCPYATDLIRTLAEDLEMPYLFRIRYRKALAPVAYPYFSINSPIKRIASRAVVQRCKAIR